VGAEVDEVIAEVVRELEEVDQEVCDSLKDLVAAPPLAKVPQC